MLQTQGVDTDAPTVVIAELQSRKPAVFLDDTNNALPAGYQLFEYRIDDVLGQGGFGITYIATDINLNSKVAVKEYFPEQFACRSENKTVSISPVEDLEYFQRGLKTFLTEARTLAVFRHPNIVRVARFFEANNTAFIVLEYEDGKSLKSWWSAAEGINEERLIRLLLPLMEGLGIVHKSGYLHRDIKPDNIIVRNDDGSLVLLDFGASRSLADTQVENIVTPGYGPIEQYSGAQQGPYTDIYALGATLYWMVTGKKPQEATERAKNDTLRPAAEVGLGKFTANFLNAIDWALKVKPEERPQDVNEFASALCSAHRETLDPASAHGELLLGNSRPSLVHRIYLADTFHSRRARTIVELEQLTKHGKRISIMVLDGSIVAATADNILQRIEKMVGEETTHIILDMRRVNYIDEAGALALIKMKELIFSAGKFISFAHINSQNSLWLSLQNYGVVKAVPKDDFFDDTDRALEAAEDDILIEVLGLRNSLGEMPLSKFSFMETMSPEELAVLEELIERRVFSAGENVFLEGTAGSELFIIAEGLASVYRTLESGRGDYRVITFGPDMVFGEMALLDSKPRSASVKSDTKLTCYALSREHLAILQEKDNAIAVKLLLSLSSELAKRLRSANQTISSLQI